MSDLRSSARHATTPDGGAKPVRKLSPAPQDSARPQDEGLFVYQRDNALARTYFLKRQGGRCAICGTVDSRLVVDHEHSEVALVRGLLCDKCNQGLGWFLDHPGALETAADYIREHDARNEAYLATEDWQERSLKRFWEFPTDEQIKARNVRICQMVEEGYERTTIAKKFAITPSQVGLIYLIHAED